MKYLITEQQLTSAIKLMIERFIKMKNYEIVILSDRFGWTNSNREFFIEVWDSNFGSPEIDMSVTYKKDDDYLEAGVKEATYSAEGSSFEALGMNEFVDEYFLEMLDQAVQKFPLDMWLDHCKCEYDINKGIWHIIPE